mmetsp:Transcript_6773/g.14583  ORF Transcript_6773/g.14583 Transcript_6773/m.14583 type:complete len:495 (-) Transcript_6773:78-1562(-)
MSFDSTITSRAYLDVSLGGRPLGRLIVGLYGRSCPETVRNFLALCRGGDDDAGLTYRGSPFHRLIRGFMLQGGDHERGDGTGGSSIYGTYFPDENLAGVHAGRGTVAMANVGKDTNGSQFYITFRATPHLDGRHVVFGCVDFDFKGGEDAEEEENKCGLVLDALEKVAVERDDRPKVDVIIVDCGVIEEEEKEQEADDGQLCSEKVLFEQGKNNDNINSDGAEIDLDDDDDNDDDGDDNGDDGHDKNKTRDDNDDTIQSTEEKKKVLTPLQQRLQRLKMKMNQSRNLNRREALEEGRRRGIGADVEDDEEKKDGSFYMSKSERKRVMKEDRMNMEKDWKQSVMYDKGIKDDFMVEPANEAMSKAYKKAVTAKCNRFDMEDTHNPEGQHRNYQRNLKSLPKYAASSSAAATKTYDPLEPSEPTSSSREGALRLAYELRRRAQKSKAKRAAGRLEFEGEEVSAINKRNKRFNEKIGRNYDKHTAEIRQNLERGTAL